MKNVINKLVSYIEDAKKTHPEITPDKLVENGAIYYRNGNDGTKFDWRENHRTCEFMCFYKTTDLGFIKVFIQSDGNMVGYIYLDEGKGEIIKIKPEFIGITEAENFKDYLNLKADLFGLWDKDIIEIFK